MTMQTTTDFTQETAAAGTAAPLERDAQRPLPLSGHKEFQQLLHRSALPHSGYQELKHVLHRKLLDRVNLEALSTLGIERMRLEIRTAVAQLVEEQKSPLTLVEKENIIEEVLHEVFGLGPLEPLLQDPSVSDILVTTPHMVYVERDGKLYPTSVEFKDNGHLLRIIDKIVSTVGRHVDESSPMVDARLIDGSRVNAVVAPIAVDGPLLSIRRFRKDKLRTQELIKNFTMTAEMVEFLKACVKARLNIIISGGTGAGKTTLLNVISEYIPEDERIVTIEDAAELQLRQRHVARMETRPPNLEGQGSIRQRQLVINALRMRPDRIIVGEVRGEEALDMLQAMNTGHDGSLTTIHSNSPRDALSRLEVMISMANSAISLKSVRQQVSSAVDLFVQIARMSDGTRRVTYITECVGMEGEQVTLQDVFLFEKTGLTVDNRVKGRFQPTGIRPKCCERLQASGIHLPPALFETVVEIN
jgi:pilus assembly protein CpaF